jgi:hypothetical protein
LPTRNNAVGESNSGEKSLDNSQKNYPLFASITNTSVVKNNIKKKLKKLSVTPIALMYLTRSFFNKLIILQTKPSKLKALKDKLIQAGIIGNNGSSTFTTVCIRLNMYTNSPIERMEKAKANREYMR